MKRINENNFTVGGLLVNQVIIMETNEMEEQKLFVFVWAIFYQVIPDSIRGRFLFVQLLYLVNKEEMIE